MMEKTLHILRDFLNFMLFNSMTNKTLERLDKFQTPRKKKMNSVCFGV